MSALDVIISFSRGAHGAVSLSSLSRTCIKQKKQENMGEHSKIMPYFHSFHLNVIVLTSSTIADAGLYLSFIAFSFTSDNFCTCQSTDLNCMVVGSLTNSKLSIPLSHCCFALVSLRADSTLPVSRIRPFP